MQKFVTNLVLASFLAHVVLGCCSHHAHGERTSSQPAAESSKCCSCSHHEQAPSEEPSDHDPCDEASCVFIAAEVSPPLQLSLGEFCTIVASFQHDSGGRVAFAHSSAQSPPAAIPLRLDLLNQSLLL